MDSQRKLLVLDLDETLVHATERALARPPDFTVAPYGVYRRPHLDAFLSFAFDQFEVGIWTSSGGEYARGVVEGILPDSSRLRFLWSRGRCTRRFDQETRERYWLKDLKKLKRQGHDLRQIIMVDDSPEKLRRQYGNLVRIRPFEGDPNDLELLLLKAYLEQLRQVDNIRRVEKRGWRDRASQLLDQSRDRQRGATGHAGV